jgi:hypothetical protein
VMYDVRKYAVWCVGRGEKGVSDKGRRWVKWCAEQRMIVMGKVWGSAGASAGQGASVGL